MDKKPEEYSLEYAGFWIRLAAGIIDLAIVMSLIYSISSIIIRITSDVTIPFHIFTGMELNSGVISLTATSHQLDPARLNFLLIFSITVLIIIMYTIGMWVWQGQTLGKMVTGIKIIRTDSSPLAFPHAVRRFFGFILCAAPAGIGFIWIAFDSRKQGIHDKIADTYVVKLPVRQVMLNQSYTRGYVRQI